MHDLPSKLAALRQKQTAAAKALEIAAIDKQLIDAEIDALLLLAAEVRRERELALFYPMGDSNE